MGTSPRGQPIPLAAELPALALRYDRTADTILALLTLAAALICHRRLRSSRISGSRMPPRPTPNTLPIAV